MTATPDKLSDELLRKHIDTQPVVVIDPNNPANEQAVNSDGSTNVAIVGGVTVTGGATSSNQVTELSSLSSIKTDLDAILARSTPVTVVSGTGAASTTANTDYSYTFASQVSRVVLQNNSPYTSYVNYDAPSGVGFFAVPPNTLLDERVLCTVLHIYTAGVITVNGATAAGLIVQGRA